MHEKEYARRTMARKDVGTNDNATELLQLRRNESSAMYVALHGIMAHAW